MKKKNILLLAFLMVLLLGGCGLEEKTKTLVLPPSQNMSFDDDTLRISHIQTHQDKIDSGTSLKLSWGKPGEDLIFLLREEDGIYWYETVNTRTGVIEDSIFVEDRVMCNPQIAPGGRYLSYEVWEDEVCSLMLYSVEQQFSQTLEQYEGTEDAFCYVWSDDGSSLISWPGIEAADPFADWQVTCYQIGPGKDGGPAVSNTRFLMEGSGFALRDVLPNADGSGMYVWEQFLCQEADSDIRIGEASAVQAAGGTDARNWLLDTETAVKEQLLEYAEGYTYPLKYTSAGVFYQDEEGALCLARDIKSRPVASKLLLPVQSQTSCICENGDHVFWVEWLDAVTCQVSGIRVTNGEAEGDPVVLYQDNMEVLEDITVIGDDAVVFWGQEFFDDGGSTYKITALEY